MSKIQVNDIVNHFDDGAPNFPKGIVVGSGATLGFNVGTGASIYSPSDNVLTLGTNNSERLRITSGGDVNIGPSANANGHGLLTLSQSASAAFNALVIQQGNTAFTATDGLQIGIDAGVNAYFKLYENRDFYFTTGTSNTEKLRIDSDNTVHIGKRDGNQNVTHFGTSRVSICGPDPIATSVSKAGSYLAIGNNESELNGVYPITFGYTNNTNSHQPAYIAYKTINAGGSEYGDLLFGTRNVTSDTEPTERLRINSAGNVTIGGKVDPAWHSTVDALTVGYAGVFYEDSYSVGGVAGRDNYLIIGNNTYYASDGQNKYINNDEAMRIYMHAGQFAYQNAVAGSGGNNVTFADRLLISSHGDVRMGEAGVTMSDSNPFYSNSWSTTAGYNKCFTIASNQYANIRLRGEHSVDAEFTLGVGNGTYYMAYDDIGNVHRLTCIASTGIVSGNLNDTSDEKLKENITSMVDGQIDIIKQLRPVNFDWKKGTLKGQSGFIAQEVKTVIPDLVDGEEYVEDDFESVGYSVNTNGLVSHLTKALQEAISKIEALETRLTDAGL